jgi:hypothetical protein
MWLDVQGVDFQNHGDDFVEIRQFTPLSAAPDITPQTCY